MAFSGQEAEFNIREWDRNCRLARENPSSRRFSASYIRSFQENHKSSRTNFIVSSTASSPAYSIKDEIDPSTYSFTTALKALQAKTVKKNWDWLKAEGFELNSKWNEAEKYICNPLSGEVPIECLSSKTLNSTSFRNLPTMSAPLIISPYFNNPTTFMFQPLNPNFRIVHDDLLAPDPVVLQENKVMGLKRNVGVQSTPVNVSSGSPSPTKTPPIIERTPKPHVEANDSPLEFAINLKAEQENLKLEEEEENKEKSMKKKKNKRGSGCLSWMIIRQTLPIKSNFKFKSKIM